MLCLPVTLFRFYMTSILGMTFVYFFREIDGHAWTEGVTLSQILICWDYNVKYFILKTVFPIFKSQS